MKQTNTKNLIQSLSIGIMITFISGATFASGTKVKSLKFELTSYKRGDKIYSLPRKYEVVKKCGRDVYYFDGVYVRPQGDHYTVVWAKRKSPDFKRYTATAVVIPGGSR